MRAFVTGASGLIGTRLISRLVADGVECAGMSLTRQVGIPTVQHVLGDCADSETVCRAVAAFAPDVVYHCAMTSGHAHTPAQRLRMLHASVLGTAATLEAAEAASVSRFVYAGSFLAYAPSNECLSEQSPLGPTTARGIAKYTADMLVQQMATRLRMHVSTLRIFSVYGPGEAPTRFIPRLLRSLRDNVGMPLITWPRHDLVFVDDVVHAMMQAATLDFPTGEIFNIGSGHATTNGEVVAVAEAVTGKTLRVEGKYPGSPADSTLWCADIAKARRMLAWTPQFDLAAGLTHAYGELCRISA